MGLYCVRVLPPQVRVGPMPMQALAAVSVILAVFAMVPLFSASEEADDIVNVSWAWTEEGPDDGLYIGINKFAVASGDDNEAYSWGSDTCGIVQDLYGEHFCNECEHGGSFVIGFAAVFFVFSVLSAAAAVWRAVEGPGLQQDIIAQHAVVACSVVSFIFGITAVAVFVNTCRRYWPFSGHDYEYGPAAVLTIFVCVAKVFEVIAHCLLTQEPLHLKSTLQAVDDGNAQL